MIINERWLVGEAIAEGGFGKIFKVYDKVYTNQHEPLAIKVRISFLSRVEALKSKRMCRWSQPIRVCSA